MPLHTFRCDAGHTFEALTKLDLSDAPTHCQERDMEQTRENHCILMCRSEVRLLMSATAGHFPGADSWRK